MNCEKCGDDLQECKCNESILKILGNYLLIPLIVLILSSIILWIVFLQMKLK